MTSQVSDIISIDGDYYSVGQDEFILEPYLDSQNIAMDKVGHNDDLLLVIDSSCWRGYVAIWQIRDNKIFLEDVRTPNMLESLMTRVFQGSTKNELIHANWYSGKLLIVGLYDDKGRMIGQNPPDISNVRPINHSADIDVLAELDEENNALFGTSFVILVKNGNITDITRLDPTSNLDN